MILQYKNTLVGTCYIISMICTSWVISSPLVRIFIELAVIKGKRGLLRAIKTCDFNVNLYNTGDIYLEKYFRIENYFQTCICEIFILIAQLFVQLLAKLCSVKLI